jgi:hypothetical protein
MLKKWTLLLVVAVGTVLPSLALAQPEAGNWELTLAGRGSNDDDWDSGAFLIGAKVGYFYTKELEIFVKQDVDVLYEDGGEWGFFTALGMDYHFDLDEWQPFVGAQVGYFYGDDTVVEDTGAIGPEVGVKYFVNNTTFIYGELGWVWFWDSDDDDAGDEDDSRWTYSVGIGFQW